MNIIMFITFCIIDIILIVTCRLVYGKCAPYAEGMIMAVHIPEEEVNNKDVEKICQWCKDAWRTFQWGHLITSCLICGIIFVKVEIFMVVWFLWLIFFSLSCLYISQKGHREMYKLKIKNGWINESTRHMIYVDTKNSSLSKQMVYSWKWQCFSVTTIILAGILLRNKDVFTIYLPSIVIMAIFTLLHWWIEQKRNVVYSKNQEINFRVNQMVKRTWSLGMLMANGINGLVWIYLSFRALLNSQLNYSDFKVYTTVQILMGIILMVSILSLPERKRKILLNNGEAMYVDDDEYWKNGWYNNPMDNNVFVEDRMSSMNITLNMARPASKVIFGITVMVMAVILCWQGYLIVSLMDSKVKFEINESVVKIEASGYKCDFNMSSVEKIEILDQIPEDRFVRINGASIGNINVGRFRDNDGRSCMMFLNNEYKPILKITLMDKIVYVNSKESGAVEKWYEKLER